jgi:hypothetical protein
MCTDGVGCKRRVCFFAHAEGELRKPDEDPVWAEQQMQAEMAAGAWRGGRELSAAHPSVAQAAR